MATSPSQLRLYLPGFEDSEVPPKVLRDCRRLYASHPTPTFDYTKSVLSCKCIISSRTTYTIWTKNILQSVLIVVHKLLCVVGIAHQYRRWMVLKNGPQLWDVSVLPVISLCYQKGFIMAGLRKSTVKMQSLHTLIKVV